MIFIFIVNCHIDTMIYIMIWYEFLSKKYRLVIVVNGDINIELFKDRAHLSTFKIFIFEKFSCFIVLIVFLVIV